MYNTKKEYVSGSCYAYLESHSIFQYLLLYYPRHYPSTRTFHFKTDNVVCASYHSIYQQCYSGGWCVYDRHSPTRSTCSDGESIRWPLCHSCHIDITWQMCNYIAGRNYHGVRTLITLDQMAEQMLLLMCEWLGVHNVPGNIPQEIPLGTLVNPCRRPPALKYILSIEMHWHFVNQSVLHMQPCNNLLALHNS